MDSPNYYAVIPANVRYNKNLSSSAKLLYGEITALCNKTGECWATNKYFSELYGVSDRSIRDWVSDLQKEGVIEVVVTRDDSGTNRIIRLLSSSCQPEENFRPSSEENFLQNNTRDEYYSKSPSIVPPRGPSDGQSESDSDRTVREAVEQFEQRWNNELCKDCPFIARIIAFNDSRKKQVKARLKEAMKIRDRLKLDKPLLDFVFDDIIRYRCSNSDFLQGKVEPVPGRSKFRFSIDHFCRPSFFANLVDGKYTS